MAFSPSSPVTGSAQTGLTSPTYTLTADVAPTPYGKQYAVTTRWDSDQRARAQFVEPFYADHE